MAVLIDAATAGVAEPERESLRRGLLQAVASGDAVLLLDGLDECRERRAVVADGLANVIRGLPPDTGVILSTRDSGMPAAVRLSMPEARLAEPDDMASVLASLLRHSSQRIPVADRDHWVSQREQQLDEVRSGHPDLFDIPLFAALLTLLLVQRERRAMPRGRAQLLAAAVQDTVQQWEVKRLAEDPVRPHASGDQLLDGFAAISHAYMSQPGGCSAGQAMRQVEAMLTEQWGLSPGEARERARDIFWLWDEHVSVFTGEDDGIQPRSRVFAEVGEAMWAVSRTSEELHEWITSALDDDDFREQVILAAGLSDAAADELIHASQNEPQARPILWAADAAIEGAHPSTGTLELLMRELANAASEEGTGERASGEPSAERQAWRYVVRLAMLPLPADQRPARQQMITELAIGDYEHLITAALAALADAKADSIAVLDPGQLAAVKALLARPLPKPPPRGQLSATGGYESGGDDLLPGHQEAAQQAVQYAAQLGTEAAEDIYRITYRGGFFDFERVSNRLYAEGFLAPKETRVNAVITEMLTRFGGAEMSEIRDIWPKFFETAASLSPIRPLSKCENWRYPDIATLAYSMFSQQGRLSDLVHAFSNEQTTLRNCMLAVVRATSLDEAGVSAQAVLALEASATGDRDVVALMTTPQPTPSAFDPGRLNSRDKNSLADALKAHSAWLSNIARALLGS